MSKRKIVATVYDDLTSKVKGKLHGKGKKDTAMIYMAGSTCKGRFRGHQVVCGDNQHLANLFIGGLLSADPSNDLLVRVVSAGLDALKNEAAKAIEAIHTGSGEVAPKALRVDLKAGGGK